MKHYYLERMRRWGVAGLMAIILAGLGGVTWAATPMPDWGRQGYPFHPLTLQEKGSPAPVLHLQGARNEVLLLFFELAGTPATHLGVEVTGKEGAPPLDWQVFQLRPVPDNLPQKFYWDGLVPLGSSLIYPEPPARVMVRITIRPGHPAGVHHYDLIFRHGQRWCRQPLEMKVWNVTLPADLPISIMAGLNPRDEWFKRYGVGWEQVAPAYLRLLREYKINAVGGFYSFPVDKVVQGQPLTDFPQYLKMLDLIVQLGYRHFRLPIVQGAPKLEEEGSTFKQQVDKFYPVFYRYLKSKGWVDKALVKVWDEPYPRDFPQVVKAYGLVKAAVPELRTDSAGGRPSPELARVVDIWMVYSPRYDSDKAAAARRQGQEIWLYANVLHGHDRPPTYQRVIGWYLYQYGISGYYLWCVNCFPLDPWTTLPRAGRAELGGDWNRKGAFLYPDPQTGMPLPTLRLETLRRGWQDYQYFVLVAEAAQRGKISPDRFKKFQEKLASLTTKLNSRHPEVRWGDMEDMRLTLGEWLDKAGN